MPATPPRLHVLAKPTGAICNLDCSYCFFLEKERLYPDSRFRMSDELLETYIRQLIESHRTDRVTVAWQGGEPTLRGLDFFRRAIEYQEKYRKPGMSFENTMQTNGSSPVEEPNRSVAMPLDRQLRYALGVQYDWNEKLTLGLAYEFLDAGSADIFQSRPFAGTLVGDYSPNHIQFVNVNLIWRF